MLANQLVMKKLSSTINAIKLPHISLAAAILFSSLLPVAAKDRNVIQSNSFDAVVYVEKAGSLHVNVDAKKAIPMQILIKDSQGSVLHEELIHRRLHRFGISFNCSGLPEGDYKIQISNRQDSESRQFSIAKKEVQQLKIIN
jgi:hypothetical protein